jgi:hypothetical protein
MKLVQSSMWVEIDVRHMKEAPSTLLRYISKKGQHVSKVGCPNLSWAHFHRFDLDIFITNFEMRN